MKIDFSAKILDLENNPIKEGDKDVTLGMIIGNVCCIRFQDEPNLSGDEQYKRFSLAMVASRGGQQELKVEDVTTLKMLIAKGYTPLVVGRAYDIIDPPAA